MSGESILWLNYCGAAVIGFLAIFAFKWTTLRSLLAGVAASLFIFLFLIVGPSGFADPWFAFAVWINFAFALMFAFAGVLAARVVRGEW